MFFAVVLVLFAIVILVRLLTKRKPVVAKSEGETLKNKYIIDHEKKLKDDADYEEYLEWCKFKGELPADREGFDEYDMKEYQHYKKLMKYGIK